MCVRMCVCLSVCVCVCTLVCAVNVCTYVCGGAAHPHRQTGSVLALRGGPDCVCVCVMCLACRGTRVLFTLAL